MQCLPFFTLVGARKGSRQVRGQAICRALSFLGVLLQSLIARGKGQTFSYPFATPGQALLMFCLSDEIMGAGSPEGHFGSRRKGSWPSWKDVLPTGSLVSPGHTRH